MKNSLIGFIILLTTVVIVAIGGAYYIQHNSSVNLTSKNGEENNLEQSSFIKSASTTQNIEEDNSEQSPTVTSDSKTVMFTAPYPIVWEDTNNTPNFGGNGKFSLIGVTVGDIVIDNDTLTSLWNGFNSQDYTEGQVVHALTLHFKIQVKDGGQLPQGIRLVTIEGNEIDKVTPPHRDYLYPNHKPSNDFLQSDTTIQDARVFFPVDQNQNEFIINTGGVADIYFRIVVNDKKITVTKLLLHEIPTFKRTFTGTAQSGESVALLLKREGDDLAGTIQSKLVTGKLDGVVLKDGTFTLSVQGTNIENTVMLDGDLSRSMDSLVLKLNKTGTSSVLLNLNLGGTPLWY